jgi:selenocysteine-specific elongation factor
VSHPVVLGTAGHIDHGKTSLVKALTGIDTDRLKEEQRRGITIELGFAHLLLGEQRLGVVDVPGHERFIKSMVAGAGGIDLVMLVIAADEGVMPQTREHLDICQLLGVQRGLVALTKMDLVDADWIKLVQDDLQKTLAGTFLEGAPVVPCSATTGAGLEELRQVIAAICSKLQPRDPRGLLRLPLDRVFSMKGFGTVVTGTLLSGTLALGQDVRVLPGGVDGKVRGIQVHGEAVEHAVAGQRTAVNLGGVERQAVARGEVLSHPGTLEPSLMIDVRLRLLPGLRRDLPARARLLFHIGTRQQEASCILLDVPRLQAGQSALAQLRFDQPVVALPGDRFIVRGFQKLENYGTTIGGGEVLRVLSRRLRPRDEAELALLRRIASAEPLERVALELLGAGARGLSRAALQQRLPLTPAELERALARLRELGTVIRFDRDSEAMVHAEPFAALRARALELVDRHHAEHPLEAGISREELRSRLVRGGEARSADGSGGLEPRLFFAVLQALEKAGELVVERELCHRPGHTARAAATSSLEELRARVFAAFERAGLAPPRDQPLAAALGAAPGELAAALKLLCDSGAVVRVADLYFSRRALDELRGRLIAFLEREGQINPTQWKELVGQSRKFAIPLAEHFDAQKVTLRVGDLRKLRR